MSLNNSQSNINQIFLKRKLEYKKLGAKLKMEGLMES